jgi:5-methylcytosine-specific restriction protein A
VADGVVPGVAVRETQAPEAVMETIAHPPRHETAVGRRHRLGIQKGQCSWCGEPVPKGRRHWCSEACVNNFNVANNTASTRWALEKRDHGVCALCGQNTKDPELLDAKKRVQKARLEAGLCRIHHNNEYKRLRPDPAPGETAAYWSGRYRQRRPCRCFFCVLYRELEQLTAWEADHIVPVAEGGGQCSLNGYRTLCLGCHKAETRKLRKRLARPRPTSTDEPLALYGELPDAISSCR